MKPTLRVLLAGPLVLPVSAWGQQVTNLDLNLVYTTGTMIQDAIDDANSGNRLELSAGTYTEAVSLARDITIQGAGAVTWTASSGSRIIELDAGVAFTLDGITVSSAEPNRRAIDAGESGNRITIRNSTLDTFTTGNGGALSATDPLSIDITDTVFRGNGTPRALLNGGAIHVTSSVAVPVTLTDVTFDQIVASDDGGAIFARGVDLTCTRCTFDGTEGGIGGAIYAEDGNLAVTDSLFCGAQANSGGAIYGDGGGTLHANRFVESTASLDGGALYANGGTWDITNNHFLGNGGSAAIQGSGTSHLDIVNNLFLDGFGFGIDIGGGSSLDSGRYNWFHDNNGTIQGDTLDGTNTLIGDPLLVDWDNGHCDSDQLIPTPILSPLLDAGDPTIFDPDGSISDVGAFGGPDADPAYHVDSDGDGASFLHDCDDDNADSYPGNPEVCDAIDNDCNGLVDDNPEDIDTFYPDCDGDGEGTTDGALTQCFEPAPLSCGGDWISANQAGTTAGLDCDDDNALVNTSADESCTDGDQNCDGDDDFGATDGPTYFVDGDGDGYGGFAEPSCDTVPPPGYVEIGGDCNDLDGDIHPGATDDCGDGDDTDCNGGDGDDTNVLAWYPDTDHDGYGEDTTTPTLDCNDFGASGDYTTVDLALDCDDTSADINPEALEVCNGVDDDCNDISDDVLGTSTWYEDQDGDLFGNTAAPVESSCPPDAQWVAQGGDCNDGDTAIHPGAKESCNKIDDDCDGQLDAEDPDTSDVELVWEDWDADGYGACDEGDAACEPFAICPADRTENHASNADDCDDANAARNPSRQETPGNAIDENCDGSAPGNDGNTDDPGEDPGCQCTTSPRPGSLSIVGLLLLLSIRRRRP